MFLYSQNGKFYFLKCTKALCKCKFLHFLGKLCNIGRNSKCIKYLPWRDKISEKKARGHGPKWQCYIFVLHFRLGGEGGDVVV